MSDKTTLSIRKETRNAIAAIGGKDQSFDEILQLLLKKWERKIEF